jgi:hypothetical protein
MALLTPKNEVGSALSAAFTRGTSTTIALDDGSTFPSTGIVRIDDNTEWCLLRYAAKSGNTLQTLSNADAEYVSSGGATYVFAIGSTVDLVMAAEYVTQHATAIHTDQTGEISGLSEKATPANDDLVIIEDSAASYAKKKVKVSNLPGGGSTSGATTFIELTDTPANFTGSGGKVVVVNSGADALEFSSGFSATGHTHSESDISDLGSYSEVGHTHSESDIADLGTYTEVGHTHSESDISDLEHNAVKIQGFAVSGSSPSDTQVLIWNNTASEWQPGAQTGASGTSTFLGLTDTPLAYSTAGYVVAINSGATGLEFIESSGASGSTTFIDLTDTPAAYTSKAGYYLMVNSGATGVSFLEPEAVYPSSGRHTETFSSESQVVVTHNLGQYPVVQVFNASDIEVLAQITHGSTNECTIDLSETMNGRIVCVSGGVLQRGFSVSVFDSDTSVATGDGTFAFTVPATLNGWDLSAALASVHTKGVTGTTDVQIRRRRNGSDADMLSTKITIGDEYYASDGVISSTYSDVETGDQIYVDVDAIHSGTAPKGLFVSVTFEGA